MYKRKIGQIGERYAAEFLVANGYKIINQNFHSRYGEIDIIALHDYPNTQECLFVEVKTRTSFSYGLPQEAITYHKYCRIRKTISHFFATVPSPTFKSWRIDLIAVILNKNKELVSLEHLRNIQIF